MSKTKDADSTIETLLHARRVDELLLQLSTDLLARVGQHDRSKLEDPEKEMFDKFSPRLKDSTYGSDEYKSFLVDMGPALEHHYDSNRHHPEHHNNGIAGMNLVDLVEMLADWKAASERHANGDLKRSLVVQKRRFDIDRQLYSVLYNTARDAGWI